MCSIKYCALLYNIKNNDLSLRKVLTSYHTRFYVLVYYHPGIYQGLFYYMLYLEHYFWFRNYEARKKNQNQSSMHSMARTNLNESEWLVTNTTATSKYTLKRPRLCISKNPTFQTKNYLVKVTLNVSIVK